MRCGGPCSPSTTRRAWSSSPGDSPRWVCRSCPRGDRGDPARGRAGGHPGRRGDGIPRDARRPSQDAAPTDPRWVARRQAQARAPCTAGRARDRAVRSRGREPVSVPRDGRLRSRAGRRDREDRHRRTGDGPGRREELRVRGRRRRSDPIRRRCWKSSAAAADFSRDTRERLAAAAFAHTAAYDAAVAGWFAEQAPESGLPGFVGLTLEKVGDLRYGENPHQRGALYRETSGRDRRDRRAARGRSRPPRQGHVVQQLARCGGGVLAGRGPAADGLRDREAQQPVRGRGRRTAGRGLPARVRLRHGLCVRRDRRLRRDVHGRPPRRRCETSSPRS